MGKIVWALLGVLLSVAAAGAAEKIRIGFPELAVQFLPLPLGEKRAYSRKKGFRRSSSA